MRNVRGFLDCGLIGIGDNYKTDMKGRDMSMSKLNRDVVLGELLELCEELGRTPTDKEIYAKDIVGCSKTL